MKTEDKKIFKLLLCALVLLSAAAVFFAFNTMTPLYKDDYSYSYTFAVKENKFKITNFSQVIDSQINHYKVMNGRIFAHTLAQTFLIFDKTVFNIVNTIAFVFLILLIYRNGTASLHKSKPLLMLFPIFSLFIFTPSFGESFLWETGSCNYMWGMLLILVYLTPLVKSLEKEGKPRRSKVPFLILYFIFAVICGFTNENNSAALLVMNLLLLIFISAKEKRLHFLSLAGLTGNICGLLIMVLAPGQQIRLGASGGLGGFKSWLERIIPISKSFLEYLWILLLLVSVLFIAAIIMRCKKKMLIKPLIFLTGTFASVYSMIISPYFPKRAWSGPVIFLTLTVVSLADAVLPAKPGRTVKIFSAAFFVLMSSLFVYTAALGAQELLAVKEADNARVQTIYNAKLSGESNVYVDSICGNGRFTCFDKYGDLNDDADSWPNTALAMYFEVDKIIKKQSGIN